MQELRREYPLAGLLAVARLARSSFYYQLELMWRPDKHARLKARILAVFDKNRGKRHLATV